MIEFQDEILDTSQQVDNEPRYDILSNEGNEIQENVKIALRTPVIQEGTPINKGNLEMALADGYLSDRYNIPEVEYITDGEYLEYNKKNTKGESYTKFKGNIYRSIYNSKNLYMKNANGEWEVVYTASYNIDSMVSSGDKIILGLYSGRIAYSTDGINFTTVTLYDNSSYYSKVFYNNGVYICVCVRNAGYINYVYVSSDGIDWTQKLTTSDNYSFYSVLFENEIIAIVMYTSYPKDQTLIYSSTDGGQNWSSGTGAMTTPVTGYKYATTFVLKNGTVYTVAVPGSTSSGNTIYVYSAGYGGGAWTSRGSAYTQSDLYLYSYYNATFIQRPNGDILLLTTNASTNHGIVLNANNLLSMTKSLDFYGTDLSNFTSFSIFAYEENEIEYYQSLFPYSISNSGKIIEIKPYKNPCFKVDSKYASLENGKIVNIIVDNVNAEFRALKSLIKIGNLPMKETDPPIKKPSRYSFYYNGVKFVTTLSSLVVTGNFTATTTLQTIDLEFEPDLVICYTENNNIYGIAGGSTTNSSATYVPRILTNAYNYHPYDGGIVDNGFSYRTNTNIVVYYIAIKF